MIDQQIDSKPVARTPIPIMGIGASAGGLEPLKQLFTHMPADTGMAFVVMQHSSPEHKSHLAEILRRYSPMSVVDICEPGIAIQPNQIYIAPPRHHIGLLNGTLHPVERDNSDVPHLPIDFMFRSLAQDQYEHAMGMILSGTGTDGTLGVKAIKEAGGMVLVQQPDTAEFDGMPTSAIETGLVDYVLPIDQMPSQLMSYIEHFLVPGRHKETPLIPTRSDALQQIFIILRSRTGHDFSLYKPSRITRCIERRMIINQIERIEDYVRYLQRSTGEVNTLFGEMLIGVTSFFRDPDAFEALQHIIPRLFENRVENQPIRVWVTACSTGEEAYSIAMLLCEAMDSVETKFPVQIFATDIDTHAIERARTGVYPENIAADIPAERLLRFFTSEREGYRVNKTVREMIVFAEHSLLKDPPFSKIDLISCRNVLIYLTTPAQEEILPMFHYALKPGGFLFLGASETLGESEVLFRPVNRVHKLFESVGDLTERHLQRVISAFGFVDPYQLAAHSLAGPTRSDVREITEKKLLDRYSPPALLVNAKGEILFFHKETVKYLEPPSGEANLNVWPMMHQDLRLPVLSALRSAVTLNAEVTYEHLPLQNKAGDSTQMISLTITPAIDPNEPQTSFYLIAFHDLEQLSAGSLDEPLQGMKTQPFLDLEREIKISRNYAQTVVVELEAANSELRTNNEEMVSANEELQSTNEELMTTKEQLQSVNQRLTTVNTKLEVKLAELLRSNNDMNNLLATLDVGILFLDLRLCVVRFNPIAAALINLVKTDTGRPIGHFTLNLVETDLVQHIEAVKNTLKSEKIIVTAHSGKTYRVSIRPYRTQTNAVDGLVVTFAEVEDGQTLADLENHAAG